jgi:hypothetical protein
MGRLAAFVYGILVYLVGDLVVPSRSTREPAASRPARGAAQRDGPPLVQAGLDPGARVKPAS